MDAGSFYQFHNPGNKYIRPVTNGVYFHFLPADVLIDQNRLFLIHFHGCFQIMAQLLFFCHDLHGSSAKYEAWTYQYRVADFFRRFYAVFYICHSPTPGLRDRKL